MAPVLTPKQLQILLHYYACDCDYEHASEEELQSLVTSGLLEGNFSYSKILGVVKSTNNDPLYEIIPHNFLGAKYCISHRAYAHVGFPLNHPFPAKACTESV